MSEAKPSETVLVTGASGGIGAALAREFARGGSAVVLAARSVEKLESLAVELRAQHGVPVHVISADLALAEGPQRLLARLAEAHLTVDVLVNNAGYGGFGPFIENDWADRAAMLQLNVVSLTELTRFLLPGMLERGRGGVINVASTASFQPGPLTAVYSASKAYVLSFSEAVAEEVRHRGTALTVTALCPGATLTGFASRAAMDGSKLFQARGLPDAASVAKAGYEGFRRGATVVIPGFKNAFLAQSVGFLPRSWVTRVAYRMQERVDA